MAHQLRMSAEIAEWLGDLRQSDPATATEVGAALLAVMHAGDVASLPFVAATDDSEADPRERLDVAYQRMLDVLQRLRRECAVAATRRKQLELRIGEPPAAELGQPALAVLERKLAAARRREEVLAQRNQRLQVAVDAFRTSKETAKAMATAAEARRSIKDAFLLAGIETDDGQPDADDADIAANAAEALADADRLLGSVMAAADVRQPTGQHDKASASGGQVLQLHADPLGADVRILFAIEPPGTATLLAVLEGETVIRAQLGEAIGLASDLLTEIREDGWSPDAEDTAASGPEFAEPATFLAECFPSEAGAVQQRAAAIAAAVSLRGLRGERNLAEMARLTGIPEYRLERIYRNGLQTASVREAAAYIRAFGGRLELTATIDGESRVVSTAPGT